MKSLLAIFALSLSTAWTREKPLNILLITADDLGYEAMDFLGGSLAKVTPNLSLLAKESLSFQLSQPGHHRHRPLRSQFRMLRLQQTPQGHSHRFHYLPKKRLPRRLRLLPNLF
ncbi:MAG: hypothetical protein QMC24_09165 [Akkermansiaceae bacterium]|jgi:hypothetical protein